MTFPSILDRRQVAEIRRRAGREPMTEIAAELDVPYGVAWNAAVGKTWSDLDDPPPVASTRAPAVHQCDNCGDDYTHRCGAAGRCARCYSYRQRHGHERPRDELLLKQVKLSRRQIRTLYRRYRVGARIVDLAQECGCGTETIYRRFEELNLPRRGTYRARLTPAKVRQARELHVNEGWRLTDLARRFAVSVPGMRDALTGKTWRAAGGPIPAANGSGSNGGNSDNGRCAICGLLCAGDHCRYCHQEGRVAAGRPGRSWTVGR
jgi:hypothetical protein